METFLMVLGILAIILLIGNPDYNLSRKRRL